MSTLHSLSWPSLHNLLAVKILLGENSCINTPLTLQQSKPSGLAACHRQKASWAPQVFLSASLSCQHVSLESELKDNTIVSFSVPSWALILNWACSEMCYCVSWRTCPHSRAFTHEYAETRLHKFCPLPLSEEDLILQSPAGDEKS